MPSAPRCSSRCAGSLFMACVSQLAAQVLVGGMLAFALLLGVACLPAVAATGSTSSCPCSKGPFRGSAARREHFTGTTILFFT